MRAYCIHCLFFSLIFDRYKLNICKIIICIVVISSLLFDSVKCFVLIIELGLKEIESLLYLRNEYLQQLMIWYVQLILTNISSMSVS